MKKALLQLAVLGMLVWVVWPGAVGAALVIDSAAVTPASAPVGVATQVTVTARISEPTVLPDGVNLQRLDSAGRVVSVMGLLHDDGADGDAAAADGTFTFRATVFEQTPGPLRLRVSAAFRGSLTRALSSPLILNVTGTTGTSIAVLAPADLAYLSTSPIVVSGTVGDSQAKVTINGVPASVGGGAFQASVPLVEGTNTLTAVAANSGGTTSTASVQVTLDTTPPQVAIESPPDGLITTDASVTVSGTVNDIVVGTVNSQQAQVTVNGAAAQVGNRSFFAAGVALAMGPNTIQAIATDRSGNSVTTTVQVARVPPTQPSIRIISGNNQSAPVSTTVGTPLVIALDNGLGQPVANTPVVFKVTDNNGLVTGGGSTAASVAVNTDGAGRAQVTLQLGSRSGAGSNRVEATSSGFTGVAAFTATGTPTGAQLISLDSGNNQTAALAAKLPYPFVVVVTDAGFNRLGGIPVTFTVKQGGGSFNGKPSFQMNTDPDGRAASFLSLGTEPGFDNNLVEVTFAGNKGQPVSFIASAKAPGNAADTRITGVVLDNSNNPIEGVTVRLFQAHQGNNNNTPIAVGTPVTTNAEGQFVMLKAPVGFFKLMADGTTVAAERGVFPTLEYDIVTVAGQENTVGMPLLLPVLDTVNKLCVTETTGGVLTLPDVPGFSLTVAPGSATFPGGSRTGCITVSTVNAEKSPMTPGFGQQPRFLITIQPVGTTFLPAAPITMPNLDGLQPGQVTELYSYDHDLAAFTAIGTGTVSEDGLLVRSDPGVGILKAGWHCGGNPNVPGSGEVVHVKITTAPPIVLVKDDTTTIAAVGGPLPGTYSWKVSDAAKAIIQGSTTGSSVVIKAVAGGKVTVTVRFTCDSVDSNGVHPFAEASIEVTVAAVTDVTGVGATKMTSVLGNPDIIHFVTPKGSGDVVLTAVIDPNEPDVKNLVTWEGATQDATDKLKATVSKSASAKHVVRVKIKGKVAKEVRVWVVWTTLTGGVAAPAIELTTASVGGQNVRIGTRIHASFASTATITPATIITDADRPDLSGTNTNAPPGGTNIAGVSLAGGATLKWDMSRRIARKMTVNATNPNLTLPTLDQDFGFPADAAVGNDDAGVGDENNDPYGNAGKIESTDDPSRVFELQGGVVGATYRNQTWFQEFARVEVEGTWQVVSDPLPWRVEFRFIKSQVTEAIWKLDVNGDGDMLDVVTEAMLGVDTNGDGDTNDIVAFWANDGTTSANDNAGHTP